MPSGDFKIETRVFEFSTQGEIEIIDLSDDVTRFVQNSKITEGRLVLGTWQQLVFFELDVHPRHRRVVFQILGI